MSAFSEAQKLYDGAELQEIIAFCAHNGVVIADGDVFLCAYITSSELIETQSQQRNEIKSKKGIDKADTWYVYVASGNLKRAFEMIKPVEFVAYERFDGECRLLNFERMRRLFYGQGRN